MFNHALVMTSFRSLSLLLLLCAFPLSEGWAQARYATVTGTVTDEKTGEPLAGAHVFIAASMIGTATDETGRFLLDRVPPGAHRLYVSMLGYASVAQDTLLHEDQTYNMTIPLTPAVLEMGEVTISAKATQRWQRQLRKFEELFLGTSDHAEQTTILNPEVLSFDSGRGNLTAIAHAPLLIENHALGYRIQYFLKDFIQRGGTIKYDGEPLYEALEPEHEEQAARWHENRRTAFFGSFRHYMLALLNKRWEEEGFITYRRFSLDHLYRNNNRFRINPEQLLEEGPSPTEKMLTFPGYLEVVYVNEEEDAAYLRWQGRSAWNRPQNQRSWMRLTDGPTLVDHNGEVLDPYGVTVFGYFAFERVADELPKEYRPAEWMHP